jgi:phosphotransferase system enzyme I (PtsI)
MIVLQGKGVSCGIAIGRIAFIEHVNIKKKLITDTVTEVERFHAARREAGEQLETLAETMTDKLGKKNAVLFGIHQMMLEDPDFFEPIIALIETEHFCAEFAAHTAGLQLARDFADMDDEYMRERAIDVKDIVRRITDILLGVQHNVTAGDEPLILAALDFTPSETAQFDRNKVLALVSQEGAANSHTAIFARTMGIPAIIGLGDSLSAELSGKEAALDGAAGILYVQPDSSILGDLQRKRSQLQEEHALRYYSKLTGSVSTSIYTPCGGL